MVNVHNEAKYAIAASDYRCLACSQEVACEALYYSAVIFGDGAFQRRNYCVGCWKRNSVPGSGDNDTRNGPDAFASWRSRRPEAPSERPRKVRFDPQLAMEFFLRLGQEPSSPPEPEEDELQPLAIRAVEDHAESDHAESDHAESTEPAEEAELTEPSPAEEADAATEVESPADAGPASESESDQLRFFVALLLVRKKALKFKSSIDRGGREFLLLVDRETPPRVHEVLNPGLSEGQLERLKERLGELLQMQI